MENQDMNGQAVENSQGLTGMEVPMVGVPAPKRRKKGLIIGGVAAILVLAAAAGVIVFVRNNPRETVEEAMEDEELVFSLADYGLDEDATPEEVEAKMIELGFFDPEADYSDAEDADTDSEEYCGDGSCQELAARRGAEASISAAATKGYSERASNFIKAAVEYYLSSVYMEAGTAKIEANGSDPSKFDVNVGNVKLTARVVAEVSGDELEVSSLTIYDSNDQEVFRASSEFFEY